MSVIFYSADETLCSDSSSYSPLSDHLKNENCQSELALDFSLLGFEAGNNCKLDTVISFDQTVAVSAHALLLQWLKAHYSVIFKP